MAIGRSPGVPWRVPDLLVRGFFPVAAALVSALSCQTAPEVPSKADAPAKAETSPAERPAEAGAEPPLAASISAEEAPRAPRAGQEPHLAAGIEEKAPSLFEEVLRLNLVLEPELDVDAARGEFRRLVAKARRQVEGRTGPREIVRALNGVILRDREIEYLSETRWRDSTLAAALLRRKGNCLAGATLYFLVARELRLPVRPVQIPGHVFVRWDDGESRVNIETTSRGAECQDVEYETLARCSYAEVVRAGWGRSMTDGEFIGRILVNAARHRVGEGRQEEAVPLLERAVERTGGRLEYRLLLYQVMADIAGERGEYREKIEELRRLALPGSSEALWAVTARAREHSDAGEHSEARELLTKAFASAPWSDLPAVLTQLAFSCRAERDYRGGLRYMELVAALERDDADTLYNLAILQEDDGRVDLALETIRRALEINPSSWNLRLMQAGFTVHAGDREKGLELFREVRRPRAEEEFWRIMVAWFRAVAGPREDFYRAFELALSSARETSILSWIDEDRDLDPYRDEAEFKDLVERHRARLLGLDRPAPPPPGQPRP